MKWLSIWLLFFPLVYGDDICKALTSQLPYLDPQTLSGSALDLAWIQTNCANTPSYSSGWVASSLSSLQVHVSDSTTSFSSLSVRRNYSVVVQTGVVRAFTLSIEFSGTLNISSFSLPIVAVVSKDLGGGFPLLAAYSIAAPWEGFLASDSPNAFLQDLNLFDAYFPVLITARGSAPPVSLQNALQVQLLAGDVRKRHAVMSSLPSSIVATSKGAFLGPASLPIPSTANSVYGTLASGDIVTVTQTRVKTSQASALIMETLSAMVASAQCASTVPVDGTFSTSILV